MFPRTNYEMTEADLEKILDACKPTPCIMIGGFTPSSPQDRANNAWSELGDRMGFDSMTVQPVEGKGNRFFTAVPVENKEQLEERFVREAEEKRLRDIRTLTVKIAELQAQLDTLIKAI